MTTNDISETNDTVLPTYEAPEALAPLCRRLLRIMDVCSIVGHY